MYPAIAFKSIGAFTPWGKGQVVKPLIIHYLCIQYAIIVIQVTVIGSRAYKLFVEYSNEIVIDIDILIHAPQEFQDALIFYAIGIGCADYLPAFQWFFLVVIIRKGFGKIGGQVFNAFRTVNILINHIAKGAQRFKAGDFFEIDIFDIELQFVI